MALRSSATGGLGELRSPWRPEGRRYGIPLLTIDAAVAYRRAIVSATGSRTIARPRALHLAAGLILVLALLVRQAGAVCPGDCDGNGNVTVNEIIQAVSIALGQASAATCRAIDRDADG